MLATLNCLDVLCTISKDSWATRTFPAQERKARYARLFGCATHDFNGFMGNEDVPRPRIDNWLAVLASSVLFERGNIVLL